MGLRKLLDETNMDGDVILKGYIPYQEVNDQSVTTIVRRSLKGGRDGCASCSE